MFSSWIHRGQGELIVVGFLTVVNRYRILHKLLLPSVPVFMAITGTYEVKATDAREKRVERRKREAPQEERESESSPTSCVRRLSTGLSLPVATATFTPSKKER
jgi:hypothetical protein